MHAGSLKRNTKAALVYSRLIQANGCWISNISLCESCGTPCISTRISEVRRQLPPGKRLEVMRRQEGGLPRWYYGIVTV